MTTYLVTGSGRYLGAEPGSTFVADLDAAMEGRALQRGAIEVVHAGGCSIDETRAELPRGWTTTRGEGRGNRKGD